MKKTFFTGLITLLPLILTILVFLFAIDFLTTPFLYLLQTQVLSFVEVNAPTVPKGFALFLTRLVILVGLVAATCLIGAAARKFFFRSLISIAQKIVSKIPFLRTVFKVATEIAKALFEQEGKKKTAFQYPVMVPFPSEKSGCIGFLSGTIPEECARRIPDLVPVFVPTAPHPISGYMMMVPKASVTRVHMSNEDAVKFTVSCGIIHVFDASKRS
ncbi:MAG: DUF502 domain-containing protein [Chlamydiota bacterium]